MKTCRNLGHHERMIRITVGLVFLALSGFTTMPAWGDLVLMGLGLITLLTGIVGYCPAWHGIGINTHRGDHDPSDSHRKEEDHKHGGTTIHQS